MVLPSKLFAEQVTWPQSRCIWKTNFLLLWVTIDITLCLDALIAVHKCTFHCAKTLYSTQTLKHQSPVDKTLGGLFYAVGYLILNWEINENFLIHPFISDWLVLCTSDGFAITIMIIVSNPGLIYWLLIEIAHTFFHPDSLACCQIYHCRPVILA